MGFAEYAKKLTGLKPAREVFVAFLDILGFSNFIRENSHAGVITAYQAIFRSLIDFTLAEVAEQISEKSLWLKSMGDPENIDDLEPKLDNVTINCVTMSDSIILSTSGCDFKDFLVLIATVRNLMARTLYFGFPLRGAIAQGMLTLDGDVPSAGSNITHYQMLGLPIVEAANLEKQQNWSGCAIHRSVVDKVGINIARLDPVMVTFYDVPIKEDFDNPSKPLAKLMPVVNWVYGIEDKDKSKVDEKSIRAAFAAYGKGMSANVEAMVCNTIKFFEEMSGHPVYKNEIDIKDWYKLSDKALKNSVSKHAGFLAGI